MSMDTFLLPALKQALNRASLRSDGRVLLAAVSGGVDSVALLCALWTLQQQEPFSLHAIHVEHGLRGETSLADASFVANLCERMKIPLHLFHANLTGDMHSPGAEDRARQARRQLYRQVMQEINAAALLLGHHREDQAETLFMNLLRGAGARGLRGMQLIQPFGNGLLVRPFLQLPKASLIQTLQRIGQPWRNDESNVDPCCLRNRLRLEVMPLLTSIQPQANLHMAQAAQRLGWDEDCLSSLANALLARARVRTLPCPALYTDELANESKALLLRALRQWVEESLEASSTGERSLSHENSKRLYALLAEKRGFLNLPRGLQVRRSEHYVHLLRQDGQPLISFPKTAPIPIRLEQNSYAFNDVPFTLTPLKPGDPFPDGKQTVSLTTSLLSAKPVLRRPLPGDLIQSFGSDGHKPLRRFFTDRKIDEPFRPLWPVLACGQQVLWVPAVGAAEGTRARKGETMWILRLNAALPFSN